MKSHSKAQRKQQIRWERKLEARKVREDMTHAKLRIPSPPFPGTPPEFPVSFIHRDGFHGDCDYLQWTDKDTGYSVSKTGDVKKLKGYDLKGARDYVSDGLWITVDRPQVGFPGEGHHFYEDFYIPDSTPDYYGEGWKMSDSAGSIVPANGRQIAVMCDIHGPVGKAHAKLFLNAPKLLDASKGTLDIILSGGDDPAVLLERIARLHLDALSAWDMREGM